MRVIERDVLLALLAVSAGSADGWSYFGLGHAFVANMTGNTVFLGMSLFQKNVDSFHSLSAVACYAAGVMVGSLLTRKVHPDSNDEVWPRAISLTLLFEAVLLILAEGAWFAAHLHSTSPSNAIPHLFDLLLATVAFAIGLQSAAMLQLKIPGIVTTYISGTWTTLISGLVRVKIQPVDQKRPFEERLLMQASVLAAYFLSAAATGYLLRYVPMAVGVLPALSVLFVATYAAIRPLLGR